MSSMTPEFVELCETLIEDAVDTEQADYGQEEYELSVLIYGITRYQDVAERWQDGWRRDTRSGDARLSLIREPGNAYSRAAIAIQSYFGKIGYVPDPVARLLAPHLDAGRMELEIVDAMPHEFERDGLTFVGGSIEIRLCPWTDELEGPAAEG